MYRRYMIEGKETQVGVYINHFLRDSFGTVCIGNYNRSIRKDANGQLFFTWNHKRIYCDTFLAYTPEEIIKMITKSQYMGSLDHELTATLMKYGLDAFNVHIKGTAYAYAGGKPVAWYDDRDGQFTVDLHALESVYKYDLIGPNGDWRDSYYCGDFVALVNCGEISLTVNPNAKYLKKTEKKETVLA